MTGTILLRVLKLLKKKTLDPDQIGPQIQDPDPNSTNKKIYFTLSKF